MNWFGGDDEEEVVEKVPTPRVTPKSLEATGNIGAIDDLAKATPASESENQFFDQATGVMRSREGPETPESLVKPKKFKKRSKEAIKIRAKERSIEILSNSKKEKDDEIASRKALIADDPNNEDFVKYQNEMIEMLQGHSDHFGKMIAKKESDLSLMKSPDIRGAAAGRMQDAGIAKAGAGGGPTVVNAPVTNIQEGGKTSVGMHHTPDLTTDLSLTQVNAAAMP